MIQVNILSWTIWFQWIFVNQHYLFNHIKDFLFPGTEEPSEEVSKPSYPEPQEDEDHHRSDEQVNLCLECRGSNLKTLKRRFLRLSCQATITHLKKFVALKIYNNINRFKEVCCLNSHKCINVSTSFHMWTNNC